MYCSSSMTGAAEAAANGKRIRASITNIFSLTAIMFIMAVAASGVFGQATVSQYFQGFETDGVWASTQTVSRVSSGSNGIASKTGGFHGEVTTQNTQWGGYSSVFPEPGYTTAVSIYLNVGGAFANDTRFDWTSAINKPDGTHRRDFAFNAGFYNDAVLPGIGPRFVISPSNGTGRGNSNPKNPARDPFVITASGWYTFQHKFFDNGAGQLLVELSILDAAGTPVHTWSTSFVSDPTDIIGSTVGGNRYGWFANNEFTFLAIDDSERSNIIEIFVDDDGMADGTGCDGTTPTFNTIQGAVNASVAGETISVCPGTYAENVTLNKSLTLNGAQAGVDARGRVAAESIISPTTTGITLSVGVAGAVINGFTISGGIRGIDSAGGPLNGLQVLNNRVIGFTGNGIFLNDSGIDITFNQNVIDGASKTGSGGLMHLDTDSFAGFHFTNNNITGKGAADGSTGFFVDGNLNVGVSATPRTPLFSGNLITACNTGTNLGSRAFTGGTISGNTWSNNNFDGLQGGIQSTTISGNTFSGNGRSGLALTSFGNTIDPVRGAKNTIVVGNTMSGNGFTQANGAGLSFGVQFPGTIITNQARFNRIVGNNIGAFYNGTESPINAENNWWGCNTGPGGAATGGCAATPNGTGGAGAGGIDTAPWLTLTSSASPGLVIIPATSAVTSKLTINSANADTSGSGTVPDGILATFVGTNGTVAPTSNTTTAGVTGTTFTPTTAGAGGVATTIDGQTVNAPITVLATCATVSTEDTTSYTTHPSTAGIAKTIPVNTSDLTSRGVISADFTFNYNPAVLDPTPANITVTPGTVLSGSSVININKSTPGAIVISVFENGAGTWTGAGTLVNINMRVIGAQNSTSPLTLTNFRYNNTLVCSNSVSGTLTVTSGTVSGRVTYEHTNVAKNVPGVTLSAPGPPLVTDTTLADGLYSLSGFGPGPQTVTPTKPAYLTYAAIHGITSGDASLISQHVVGLITLSTAGQKAAKVSGLTMISSYEAALVAQYIVGIVNVNNHAGQWLFTPPSRTYPNIITDYLNEDYTAILLGDVDGDWDPAGGRPAAPLTDPERIKNAVIASVPRIMTEQGKIVTVPFRIDNLKGKGVTSYQFDIAYDPAVIAPADIAAELAGTIGEGLSIASNAPEEGLFKVVVYGAMPVTGDGVYVNLRFTVVGAGGSSSPLVISQFRFNDGNADVVTRNGKVRVLGAEMEDDDSISGRLLTAYGEPVPDTRVVLTSTTGTSVYATANAEGYFEFIGLTAGETYNVSVVSKRFSFPQMISVTRGATKLSMIAEQ